MGQNTLEVSMGRNWGEGLTVKFQEGIVRDNGKFSYLDCDNRYMTVSICQTHNKCTLKRVNFTVGNFSVS